MNRRIARAGLLLAVCAGWLPGLPDTVWGACAMERERPGQTGWFIRHLGADCSEAERTAQAVKSDEVLSALKAGRGVGLDGIVLAGDLLFDAVPAVAGSDIPQTLQDVMPAGPVRRLAGPLLLTHSIVRGAIGTRTEKGYLVIQGGVTATGTTFEQLADFSRTVFAGPADFSGASFQSQAFFIEARFAKPARFERTAFGPHTRFHKAVLADSAVFQDAFFAGLAEFLEVTFKKDTNFSQAVFKMGTGFSGSRFQGTLDMSGAVFEREAFFTFTEFDGDAAFRGVMFKGTTDFSDARFQGADDFARTVFTVEPRFARVKTSGERTSKKWLSDPLVLYGLAGLLLAASLLLVWRLRRQ